jgi:hypothetical protein
MPALKRFRQSHSKMTPPRCALSATIDARFGEIKRDRRLVPRTDEGSLKSIPVLKDGPHATHSARRSRVKPQFGLRHSLRRDFKKSLRIFSISEIILPSSPEFDRIHGKPQFSTSLSSNGNGLVGTV